MTDTPTPTDADTPDFRFVLVHSQVPGQPEGYSVHMAMLHPDGSLDHVLPEPFQLAAFDINSIRWAAQDVLEMLDAIEQGNSEHHLAMRQTGEPGEEYLQLSPFSSVDAQTL